jgi:broad specificity phosphatase PhoE
VWRFVDHLYGLADEEVVAVVAHSGSLNVLLSRLLGLEPDPVSFPLYKWSTTGVTSVLLSPDRKATVLEHNLLKHIE